MRQHQSNACVWGERVVQIYVYMLNDFRAYH